ncbi:MAG: PDZ domain-containing protein [Gemmatimonadaceae bacterium]
MRPLGPMSIEARLVRGAAAALLAATAALPLGAQVIVSSPRPAKDTVMVKVFGTHRGDSVRIMRVQIDSLRDLFRAWDAEPLASLQSAKMAREIESLMSAMQSGMTAVGPRIFLTAPVAGRRLDKGWMGLTTGGVHDEWTDDGHFLRYFDYPPIVAVTRRSPAQVAGIIPGDTLIAYDGVDVVGHPINLSQLLTPDRRVAVTVHRDGETKAFTVVVGRQPGDRFARVIMAPDGSSLPGDDAPNVAADGPRRVIGGIGRVRGGAAGGGKIVVTGGPNGVFFTLANGVFGASMSQVGSDLAKTLKIEPGVLVNEVPDNTPAALAGLKAGDVIVRLAGEPVATIEDVRTLAALRGESHTVTLQVVRDKKTRTITVKW